MNQSELEKRLLEAFSEESEERLENLFSKLTELENVTRDDKRKEILEVVFREAHSLKGAARSVNLPPIESLCQSMETVFGLLKGDELPFSSHLFDRLHDAAKMVERYTLANKPARTGMLNEMTALEKQLEALTVPANSEKNEAPPEVELPAESAVQKAAEKESHDRFPVDQKVDQKNDNRSPGSDTVRISSSKLDALLLKTEELIVLKQFTGQLLIRLKDFQEDMETRSREHKKYYSKLSDHTGSQGGFRNLPEGIRDYLNLVTDNQRDSVERIKELVKTMEQGNRTVSTMVDDLLNDMKKTTLLPFSTLFAVLPRMTREIARDRNKSIELRLSGDETEIDKRILDRIKDPMIHIIRNAIDHGIESPDTRTLHGKTRTGTISIRVSQIESNRVEVTISDDGAGINIPALHAKAVKSGVIREADLGKLTEDDSLALIFHSGLTTSPLITEISGRGLGMAIVKETVENLGGRLKVENVTGRGTTLKLRLPVTQATFRGVLVSSAGRYFIIPNAQVQHVIQVRPADICRLENKPVIRIEQRAVGLVHLFEVLGQQVPPKEKKYNEQIGGEVYTAIILGSDEQQVAFVIDAIIGEQEVLVKSLGKQLGRVPLIAGATVLGSGQVVPVLNVRELILSAAEKDFFPAVATDLLSKTSPVEKRSVLVVEDSFTSRTLLKNILEASGYQVQTAIDGENGFGLLKSGAFHAVVSDVEMPRMNGFELTEKIRSNKATADTPVILVTSLDSREHRERGIDVGADAYIVKSSFDQSNLLEVLEQLMPS